MGSVFRKIIIHRVPAAATRTPSKAGEVRVSWTNRQRRKCSGKLRVGKAGEERVSYRSPEYYIRFRDEHQVLRTERSHTTDKDLAQNLLRQREKEVLELQLDPSRARRAAATHLASQDVRELINAYLDSLRIDNYRSTKSYLFRLASHFKWKRIGNVSLGQLEELRDQLIDCRARNEPSRLGALRRPQVPTLRTIRGFLVAAKGFYTWVASTHAVPNALSQLKAPRPKKAERRPRRAFSIDEISRLISAAKQDLRDLHRCSTKAVLGQQSALIYTLMSTTAIRPASIRRLRIQDVILGESDGGILVVTPKVTDAEMQRIPFGAALAEALAAWISVRRQDADFCISAPLILWPARQRHNFLKHLQEAGIDRVVLGFHVDLYALRGSWNTHAYHANVSAELRARVMGHSSTKLVESRYLLLDELAISEAVAQVEKRLAGGGSSVSAA